MYLVSPKLSPGSYPSKEDAFTQGRFKIGPPPTTLARNLHWTNIGSTYRTFCEEIAVTADRSKHIFKNETFIHNLFSHDCHDCRVNVRANVEDGEATFNQHWFRYMLAGLKRVPIEIL